MTKSEKYRDDKSKKYRNKLLFVNSLIFHILVKGRSPASSVEEPWVLKGYYLNSALLAE